MTDGTPMQAHFERLYAHSNDPYGTQSRWYEQRKRAILMASLPHRQFRRCYEAGCGNGALTAQLATRCDDVLAADFSEQALHAARERTAELPQVRLARHRLPDDWPVAQQFELVVLSEVCYFLPAPDVQCLARHCATSLAPDAVLVACDWRPLFAERATTTETVHAALATIGLHLLAEHAEDDFVLKVWSRDPRSVAQREGIR